MGKRMIPKYPFQVHVQYKVGEKRHIETRNYETLIAASVAAIIFRKKPAVTRVQVCMIVDETHHTGG